MFSYMKLNCQINFNIVEVWRVTEIKLVLTSFAISFWSFPLCSSCIKIQKANIKNGQQKKDEHKFQIGEIE